jgi:hypothetical protein
LDKVFPWKAIEADFSHGLILGNGASIAFDPRFAYHSLNDRAQALGLITPDIQRVFDHLHTADFELVLRMLWHASMINQALAIPDVRTTQAYEAVREALIAVIQAIHVPHNEVSARLAPAAAFMSRFSTVLSLSYDVLVYWTILAANEDAPNRFKDCFLGGEFQQNWKQFREPYGLNHQATLIFYPHGSLTLAADLAGAEFKLHATAGAALLDTVFERWRFGGTTPVFVSEGTSEQKRAAIRRSPYLSTVYEEVIPDLGDSVVVFGWSLHENDEHLLDAVCRGGPRRFAMAVDPAAGNLAELEAGILRKLSDLLGRNKFELTFFDRRSPGCWIAP